MSTAPTATRPAGGRPPRKGTSPRVRAQRFRAAQYILLVLLILLAIRAADWGQVAGVFFRQDLIVSTVGADLLVAFRNTLAYTAGAFVVGLILGTILALMRLSPVAPYRWLSTIYVEFFRGLPAIVVLIAFGLLPLAFPDLAIPFGIYGIVWVALGIVSSAYMSETIRAGIQAVPKGQVEAARSLGMPPGRAMRTIVLPQAFRIILPPLTNELILLTKDSSLVYILGLAEGAFELTKYGRELSQSNANLTPLVVAGLCYLVITLPLTLLVRRLEASTRKAH